MSTPTIVDSANLAAQWALVTIIADGIGGLITQAESIRDQLGVFHKARGEKFLGEWIEYKLPHRGNQLVKTAPTGPIIKGNYGGFCGVSPIHVSRQTHPQEGKTAEKATWTAILANYLTPIQLASWN